MLTAQILGSEAVIKHPQGGFIAPENKYRLGLAHPSDAVLDQGRVTFAAATGGSRFWRLAAHDVFKKKVILAEKKKTMMPTAEKAKPQARRYGRKVPDALIYEVLNGEPLYYRGYREVMSGKKTIEEIIGSSTLQFVLVNYFIRLLAKHLNEDDFYIAASEAGVHISHRDNMANDIAVYESSVLTPDRISDKYADVPPKFAIEIDIKADLSNPKHYDYVNLKTQKMLDFGTEKLIWVFTETHKVMIAAEHQDWLIMDWNRDIELLENVRFNIGEYLNKKNIIVAKKTL